MHYEVQESSFENVLWCPALNDGLAEAKAARRFEWERGV